MLFLVITLLFGAVVSKENGNVVRTSSGLIRGKIQEYEGFRYHTYLGIPYAESPTGKRRFLAPVPKKPWNDILNATKEGAVCPQAEANYKREQMNEDCLFLNIYVPAKLKRKLPVLVFLHGGGFRALSGNSDIVYGPQLILGKGIIFVTLNYRIGALGFLSLDVKEAPGNAGIKDVLLALRWVKKNIGKFSGDINRITLGGHSSGSGIASFLMLSEKSLGLFQQAIFISGSALSYRFINPEKVDMALTLAGLLGIESRDPREVANKLKNVDAFDIVAVQDKIFKTARNNVELLNPFSPTIEKDSPEAIMTKCPCEIIRNGIPNNVPMIVGVNANEGLFVLRLHLENVVKEIQDNIELLIPYSIGYPYGSSESKALAKSIAEFYFKDDCLITFSMEEAIDYLSDIIYNYPADEWIRLSTNSSESQIFSYVFDFDGDLNWAKLNHKLSYPGTCHADEIGYIFLTNATMDKYTRIDDRNRNMVEHMTNFISSFVKFGTPTPDQEGIIWPESTKDRHHLLISEQTEIRLYPPFAERMQFWSDVYTQYRQYVDNGGNIQRKMYP